MYSSINFTILISVAFTLSGFQSDQRDPELTRLENNKKLNFMVGHWTTVHKIKDQEITGKANIRWSVGGNWLQHEFQGTKPGESEQFYMKHLMNFSVNDDKYCCAMFDSFGGKPGLFFGDWEDKNTLVVIAKFPGTDGSSGFQRLTIKKVSANEFHFNRAFSDDGEKYHFELLGVYRKAK